MAVSAQRAILVPRISHPVRVHSTVLDSTAHSRHHPLGRASAVQGVLLDTFGALESLGALRELELHNTPGCSGSGTPAAHLRRHRTATGKEASCFDMTYLEKADSRLIFSRSAPDAGANVYRPTYARNTSARASERGQIHTPRIASQGRCGTMCAAAALSCGHWAPFRSD